MNIVSIIFFSIIVVALIVYFVFYRRHRTKDVAKLLPENTHIANIKFSKGELNLEFRRNGDSWQMVSPDIWDVVPEKMRRLVIKLITLDIDDYFSAASPEKSEFGIGKNGELTIDGSEMIAIAIGNINPKNSEQVYIRKTDEKGVSLISSSILDVLPKNISEFKNMHIFEGFPSNVDSLEAGSADRTYLIVRAEQGWIMSGKNLLDEKVKPFLEEVLAIQAESVMESSFKLSPKAEIYITIKISKKTITRNFFSIDDDYFVMPVESKLLKIRKNVVEFIFNFK